MLWTPKLSAADFKNWKEIPCLRLLLAKRYQHPHSPACSVGALELLFFIKSHRFLCLGLGRKWIPLYSAFFSPNWSTASSSGTPSIRAWTCWNRFQQKTGTKSKPKPETETYFSQFVIRIKQTTRTSRYYWQIQAWLERLKDKILPVSQVSGYFCKPDWRDEEQGIYGWLGAREESGTREEALSCISIIIAKIPFCSFSDILERA